jgi:hypothetical protein
MNKHLKTGLAALALVAAPLTFNAVMAQQTGSTSVVQQAVNYSKTFLAKLSGTLGIDQAKLETAIKTAGNATVDEMLKNQDITKTQAEQLRTQVGQGRLGIWENNGRPDGMERGGPRGEMGRGDARGGNDMKPGMNSANISHIALLESAAKALNLSIVELDTKLRAGETLTSLATTQKVSLESVKNAVTANLKSQLDAAVKAKTITQAQADEMLARATANPNFGLFGGRGGGRR